MNRRILLVLGLAMSVPFLVHAQFVGPTQTAPGGNPPGPVWLQTAVPTQQTGAFSISGQGTVDSLTTNNVGRSGTFNGDVYMQNGKWFRVDRTSASSTITFTNGDPLGTGFTFNINGSMNLFPVGANRAVLSLAGTSRLNVYEICLFNVCRTTWPTTTAPADIWVDTTGDTMTGKLDIIRNSLNGVLTTEEGLVTQMGAWAGTTYGVLRGGRFSASTPNSVNGAATVNGVDGSAFNNAGGTNNRTIGVTGNSAVLNNSFSSLSAGGDFQSTVNNTANVSFGAIGARGAVTYLATAGSVPFGAGLYGQVNKGAGTLNLPNAYGVYGQIEGSGSMTNGYGLYGTILSNVTTCTNCTAVAGVGGQVSGGFSNSAANGIGVSSTAVGANSFGIIGSGVTVGIYGRAMDTVTEGVGGVNGWSMAPRGFGVGGLQQGENGTGVYGYNTRLTGRGGMFFSNGVGSYSGGMTVGVHALATTTLSSGMEYATIPGAANGSGLYAKGVTHGLYSESAQYGGYLGNTNGNGWLMGGMGDTGGYGYGTSYGLVGYTPNGIGLFSQSGYAGLLASNLSASVTTYLARGSYAIMAQGDITVTSTKGIALNAIDGPLITRSWDPFTSGAYQGLGRWGLFMEPAYLTAGFPNVAGRGFKVSRYEANSTKLDLLVVNQAGDLVVTTGGAFKPGGGSWAVWSDERLKSIEGPFDRGLDEIMQIDPVHFHYSEDNAKNFDSTKEYVGLTAQSLQNIIPEAIEGVDEQGYLLVDQDPVIWTMLNAIKELKAENDALRARVEALEAE